MFLKKKNLRIFNYLYKDIQYRFRGEFCNTLKDIINSKLNKNAKEALANYTKSLYINCINPEFTMITSKDKFTKKNYLMYKTCQDLRKYSLYSSQRN